MLAGGLASGLVLVGLLVGVDEFRHPAFRSVERLTRTLRLPVFASIPRIDNHRIYESPPSGEVDPKLVVHTAPESAPAEQYRGFLPVFLESAGCRVILVTSAARGDGKSLTCMNLALSLASDLGRRVLVIDGDLRRPSAHRLLRIRSKLGLSDILRGEAKLGECAVNAKLPNLSLVPAGRGVRNPLVLLTSSAFLELLATAKKSYEVILIDSPPLLPVVDTKILRRMADMVVFVVRADATPRDGVVRSLRDMRDVAGVIFNQVSPGSFRRYYYYDAYSRYAYGDPPAPERSSSGPGHV
jgi:capsular exopolysaccharide synthesis family protein